MICRKEDMRQETRIAMRGGEGPIALTHLLESGDTFGKCRMVAKLTIPQGSGIGLHEHAEEAEMYIILQGEATVTDNGETRLLHPGDSMITGNGGTHSIANQAAEDLVLYAIVVN